MPINSWYLDIISWIVHFGTGRRCVGLHLWGWNLYTVASNPLSPGFISWMFTLAYSNSPHMTDLFPWDSFIVSAVLPKSLKYFLSLCYIENKKHIDVWHWFLGLPPADKETSWWRAVGPDPTWSILPFSPLYRSDHLGPASYPTTVLQHTCPERDLIDTWPHPLLLRLCLCLCQQDGMLTLCPELLCVEMAYTLLSSITIPSHSPVNTSHRTEFQGTWRTQIWSAFSLNFRSRAWALPAMWK